MIEIIDIQDEKKPLDITPELAVMAARVVKEWCDMHDEECVCNGSVCQFSNDICIFYETRIPGCWEIPERENNDGEDRKV